jgi:hypothetical protein
LRDRVGAALLRRHASRILTEVLREVLRQVNTPSEPTKLILEYSARGLAFGHTTYAEAS